MQPDTSGNRVRSHAYERQEYSHREQREKRVGEIQRIRITLEQFAQDGKPGAPLDFAGLVSEVHEGAIRLVTAAVDEVAGPDSTVTARAAEGRPADVLLEAARDADLLVVGSHGAGLAELLLGSVSLECVEGASGPVLIHRG